MIRRATSQRGAPSVEATASSVHLRSLTGLRWWAAIMVVLYHMMGSDRPHRAMQIVASVGYVGVTLFFVLSGFVLTWAWDPKEPRSKFFGRRFARIYPLYALSIVAFIISDHLVFHTLTPQGPIAASFAGVQSLVPTRNYFATPSTVAWSLSCEAFFYLAFPLLVARLRDAPARVLGWLVALCAAWLVVVPTVTMMLVHSPFLAHGIELHPFYRIAEFIVGICAAAMVRRGLRLSLPAGLIWMVLAAGYLLAAIVRHTAGHNWSIPASRFAASLAFTPFAVLVIVSLASADLQGRRTGFGNFVSVRLGEWSYALYLFHPIVLGSSRLWVGHLGLASGGTLTRAVLVVTAVLLAGALHHGIELPANRRIREWLRTKDSVVEPAAI